MALLEDVLEKVSLYLQMELRRQGVSPLAQWQRRIEDGVRVVSRTEKSGRRREMTRRKGASSGGADASMEPHAEVYDLCLDLARVCPDDRVAIALCEVLLKLSAPAMEGRLRTVGGLHLDLRHNGLTDRVERHLELVLTSCPKLQSLDLTGNAFSEAVLEGLHTTTDGADRPCTLLPRRRSVPDRAGRPILRTPSRGSHGSTSGASRAGHTADLAGDLRRRREELLGVPERAPATSPAAAPRAPTEAIVPPPPPDPHPRERDSRRARETAIPPRWSNEPLAGDDAKGAREPITAVYGDHVDVMANLDPLLESVLDLSALVDASGTVQEGQGFGGTETLWEAVHHHETLGGHPPEEGREEEEGEEEEGAVARAPPSSLAQAAPYTTLTVLNISGNHLHELRPLPRTLLRLDISDNLLTRLDGLRPCRMLTVLNARRNRVERISGLEHTLCMAHLFLGHNHITAVEGLAHLTLLETLDLTHNRLRSQSSLRALSLCAGLRHLLVKGNPVMEAMRSGHRVLLRNLCPTLLIIDECKLTPSRFTEVSACVQDRMQQPHSLGVALSRKPTAAGNPPASRKGGDEQRSIQMLHLLTRGVVEPTGYGSMTNAARAARQLVRRSTEEQENTAVAQAAGGGRKLRTDMVKHLALESKRYLEAAVVNRAVRLQPTGAAEEEGQSGTRPRPRHRDGEDHHTLQGAVGHAAAASTAHLSPEEVLRPYRPSRYRRRQAATPRGAVSSSHPSAPPTRADSHPPAMGGPPTTPGDEVTLEAVYVDGGETPRYHGAPRSVTPTATSYAFLHGGEASAPLKSPGLPAEGGVRPGAVRVGRSSVPGRSRASGSPPRSGQTEVRPPPPPTSPGPAPALHRSTSGRPLSRGPTAVSTSPSLPQDDSSSGRSACAAAGDRRIVPRNTAPKRAVPPGLGRPPTGAETRPADRAVPVRSQPAPSLSPRAASPSVPPASLRGWSEWAQPWAAELADDVGAVQAAIKTIVVLLIAQREKGVAVPGSSHQLPPTYLQERCTCMRILEESGMLLDTEVPAEVVTHYALTKEELNGAPRGGVRRHGESAEEAAERAGILEQIRLLSDAQTVLRYMVLLMKEGQERVLQSYVDQVKECYC